QYYGYEHYATLSDDNRLRIEAIAPTRGLIYDRNGRVLAENLPSFHLELVPERVEELDATLDHLRELIDFSDGDVQRLRAAWRHARPFEGVPLRFRLSREEVARVSVQRHRLPGVEIAAGLTRHYPYGRTAVHVLGYTGRISRGDLRALDASKYRASTHVGQTGVEATYEQVLHGDPGFRRVEANVQGRALRVIEEKSPVPGQDVRLTIDLEYQRLAEELLGDRDGAVVAIDPDNGELLAMMSAPGFDPNLFTRGISGSEYGALRDSPRRPLFNRAIRGQYPPGSTIKPVIALNGLDTGTQDRGDHINCRGYYQLNDSGRRYRDWKEHGDGIDLADAITQVIKLCAAHFAT
ncbi:MAG: penicillin-binding transpeptidase domain-containing protein, partial [Halofilum sp. (in: g-proteobacteria)]